MKGDTVQYLFAQNSPRVGREKLWKIKQNSFVSLISTRAKEEEKSTWAVYLEPDIQERPPSGGDCVGKVAKVEETGLMEQGVWFWPQWEEVAGWLKHDSMILICKCPRRASLPPRELEGQVNTKLTTTLKTDPTSHWMGRTQEKQRGSSWSSGNTENLPGITSEI